MSFRYAAETIAAAINKLCQNSAHNINAYILAEQTEVWVKTNLKLECYTC